jgi:hypothetical protein
MSLFWYESGNGCGELDGGDEECHRFCTSAKEEGRLIEARLSGNYATGAIGRAAN